MSKRQLILALSILIPACALAQNGVVQINQSTIAAGGGNRPTNGFPFVINQPGSYQLTGNLVVPPGVSGIGIAASNVILDLNGFSITVLGLNNSAIFGMGSQSMFSVRNGSIAIATGASGFALDLRTLTGTKVQDLLINSGDGAMTVGLNSIVKNNIANGAIFVICPSVIVENVTLGFIAGSTTSGSCVLWNNRAGNITAPVSQ